MRVKAFKIDWFIIRMLFDDTKSGSIIRNGPTNTCLRSLGLLNFLLWGLDDRCSLSSQRVGLKLTIYPNQRYSQLFSTPLVWSLFRYTVFSVTEIG